MRIEKYLDPRNNLVLRRIFGSEKNKNILIRFLNDVLEKEGVNEIQDIEFLQNIVDTSTQRYISPAINALCRDKKGLEYVVGTQVANIGGFETGAQYYAANVYCSQMKTGQKYENLKEVIWLVIADFVMFPDKKSYISDHVILDKRNNTYELKNFSFRILELPKFKKTNIEDIKNPIEKWCYFFNHSDNEKGMKQLVQEGDAAIENSYIELRSYNWTDEELINYEAVQKNIRDAIAREDYVREEGRAQGIAIAKGMEEAKNEIAMYMLKKNMDISLISKLTGLSEKDILTLSYIDLKS